MPPYPVNNATTVKQLLNWAQQELRLSSDTPNLDSKILFRHISDFSDVDLIVKTDEVIDQDQLESYQQTIQKRKQGIPVAYITGQKEFWSLNFKVTPDTLIPRPETELLVETVLKFIPKDHKLDIADLGTGSGAIACAIASERPNTNIIATDKSAAALEIAQGNATLNNLKNINFIQSDWFKKLEGKTFDLIVSNPPYVVENDKHLKQGDVRFEPNLALTPGSDGLRDLRCVISQAKAYLKPNGWLIVEHGYDQQEDVQKLFLATTKSEKAVIPVEARIQKPDYNQQLISELAYKNIFCLKDLNNRPRVTYGQLI